MTEPTIAECKTRLEAEGFLVIPKGRVATVRCQRSVATYMLEDLAFRESIAPNMGRQLAQHILAKNCFVLDSYERDFGAGMGGCQGTTFVLDARMIMPKPHGP